MVEVHQPGLVAGGLEARRREVGQAHGGVGAQHVMGRGLRRRAVEWTGAFKERIRHFDR